MKPVRVFLSILALGAVTFASPRALCQSPAASSAVNWIGSWAAAQQMPEPQNSLPPADLNDATLRQIVHLSAGGSMLRVHLSNAFGFLPLTLTGVHIARPVSPSSAAI